MPGTGTDIQEDSGFVEKLKSGIIIICRGLNLKRFEEEIFQFNSDDRLLGFLFMPN